MVGGVLVERTVKEVLPALESNREQLGEPRHPKSSETPGKTPQGTPNPISKLIEALAQQLQAKGRELSEFRERHNIRLVGEEDPKPRPGTAPRGQGGARGGPGVLTPPPRIPSGILGSFRAGLGQ
ncbi:hypothetical protein DUI87_29682 [Hirundo rustica rustica]|uniref:Uncharacterized protein n=1 Tax=Hirundo rustica rustica TaxID=333673 RepID=A0A3M0JGT7_HIRRU|nr:hypothetical protein DUI87_29682 [Hirundo rustica rustica]